MKRKSMLFRSLLCLLFLLLIAVCPTATGKTFYVDDDGPADFNTIQAAIDDANDGDTVLVSPGTYTGEDNRDIDFKGKAIAVKSKDGPQTCIIDCQGTEEEQHRGFYFHSGEDANSVVQGFTIINGFVGEGGAIFCEDSSPTICECTIRSNTAQCQYPVNYEGNGGGIYCNYSEALIKDCIIIDNSANPRWLQVAIGGRGGGIYCSNSNLTITGCEISNNSSALDRSGAVYCWTSNITINTCISNDNQSNGIYMYRGNLEITDSLIANNKCSGIICSEGNEAIVKNCDILKNRREGLNFHKIKDILIDRCLIAANKHIGIFERGTNGLTVNNCTITNNRMAGIYGGAINCKISNSIIWENRIVLSPSSIVDNPLCTISYSNVQGALESVAIIEGYSLNWGEGNINLDPNFASPGYWDPNGRPWTYEDDIWVDGDYHLKSQAGRWDPVSESWVTDDVTSPCIDAGDPNVPVGDEPEPNGGRINIGAYGGTPEASLSPLIGQASNPNPPDTAFGVSPYVILSWSPGKNAVAHDVYFGNTYQPKFVRNQTETDFNPGQLYPQGMLPSQAQCYWRIDEIDSHGNIIPGETWRFKVTEYKGRLCFTGQTPVWINDSFTPISKVDIGQSIDGMNRIEEVQEHEGTYTLYDILLESGNSITVAENHIFMTEAGNWLSLHELKAGTRLKTLKSSIGIQSVTKQPSPFTGKVYNLKIQGSDRYMVGRDMVIVRDY